MFSQQVIVACSSLYPLKPPTSKFQSSRKAINLDFQPNLEITPQSMLMPVELKL